MAERSVVAVPGIGELVVLGDVFCDLVLRGVPRLPDWGEEVFGAEPVLCPGGVANVAVGLARLGLPTRMLARTRARDTIGQVLAEELAQHSNLTVTWLGSAPSTAITVALPHGSERAMISYVPPASGRTLASQIPWESLRRATHLHLAAWSEGPAPLEDQTRILAEARRRGLTVSLDVSWERGQERAARIRELLPHLDVFLPNATEACWVAGTGDPEEALTRLAALVPTVVVKLGSGGAIASGGGAVERVPGLVVPVVDTTGAGDAFAAGFLHGFVRRWSVARCLALGNVCGGISVARIGSSISVPTRLEAFTALERGCLEIAAGEVS